jgi:hemerythrin
MQAVTNLLLEDHKRISSLILKSMDEESLKQLKLILHKHFKEEEIFFSKYKYATGPLIPIMEQIREEHPKITEMLNNITKELKQKKSTATVRELLRLLSHHKKLEEDYLYPEIDNLLSDSEKEEIYWKIKG